jgi:DivIVA domain-containing protein
MTPDDIKSQRFGKQLLGLNPVEVSAFMHDVAEAYASLQQTNRSLATSVKSLQADRDALSHNAPQDAPLAYMPGDAAAQGESLTKAAEDTEPQTKKIEALRALALEEMEALLHDARVEARALLDRAREDEAAMIRDIDSAKIRAAREADNLLNEARVQAQSLVAAARAEETALRQEIDRLSEGHIRLIDDVRATLTTYQEWLRTMDPRGRAPGQRKAAVADGRADGVERLEEMPAA